MGVSTLQQRIAAALAEGRCESTGSFQMDVVAAARKFGEYALNDPLQIVARLVRAGQLCQAVVRVELARKSTSVAFAGNPIDPSCLGQVFQGVLSTDAAERELSIAINSILARPFGELNLIRGEASRLARLRVSGGGLVETWEAVDLLQQQSWTEVTWTQPQARSLGQDGTRLKDWFRHSPFALTLNGKPGEVPFGKPRGPGPLRHIGAEKQILLSSAWYMPSSWFWADHQVLDFRIFSPNPEHNRVGALGESLASLRGAAGQAVGPGCFVRIGVGCDLEGGSRLDWVYRGQTVLSEEVSFALPSVRAVVACEGLPMDLPGQSPVRGNALSARRGMVGQWVDLLEDELQRLYPGTGRRALHRLLFDRKRAQAPFTLTPSAKLANLFARLTPSR